MKEMEAKSSRADFMHVKSPGEPSPVHMTTVNHLPSPTVALELDTPRAMDAATGDGIPTGAWAAGLFDCFDNLVPNCFLVTFCPCVALAQLSTRLGLASYVVMLSLLLFVTIVQLATFLLIWISADDDGSYSIHGHASGSDHDTKVNPTFVVLTLMLQVLLVFYIWRLRIKTRTQFQLPGNAVTDCLSAWFCSCCTVAQLRTHVRCYKPGTCTFGAPDVLQAYPGKSYAV